MSVLYHTLSKIVCKSNSIEIWGLKCKTNYFKKSVADIYDFKDWAIYQQVICNLYLTKVTWFNLNGNGFHINNRGCGSGRLHKKSRRPCNVCCDLLGRTLAAAVGQSLCPKYNSHLRQRRLVFRHLTLGHSLLCLSSLLQLIFVVFNVMFSFEFTWSI